MTEKGSDWIKYWNSDPPIYVNQQHKVAHYCGMAQDILSQLPHPWAVVLDYGCGEALSAEAVAARCAKLILCDAAPRIRERLRSRFAAGSNVQVLASNALEQIEDRSIDLIVANSVVQYLSREGLVSLLDAWRRKLAPHGRLILGDVVPKRVSAFDDTNALLKFAWRNRFLFGAMIGTVRILASDYRRLRRRCGFARFDEDEIVALLRNHGFVARRLPANFGYNPMRMSFRATLA